MLFQQRTCGRPFGPLAGGRLRRLTSEARPLLRAAVAPRAARTSRLVRPTTFSFLPRQHALYVRRVPDRLPSSDADLHVSIRNVIGRNGERHLPGLTRAQMNPLESAQAADRRARFRTAPDIKLDHF